MNNYSAIIKMTDEAKEKMYSRLSKKTIIKMLIESNKHLELLMPKVSPFYCHHHFVMKDEYWRVCSHCGALEPLNINQ